MKKKVEVQTTVHQAEEGEYQRTVVREWQGTVQDRRDMSTMGKVQELRRNFRFFSILGFVGTLMCTWEFIITLLTFSLTNGGTAGLFWGFIIVITGFFLVYASLAELASMAPTAGGQYHWVSEFAPPSCQKYLSYVTGWCVFLGWQAAIVAVAFIPGTVIQGLITFNNPDYVPKRWHGTLLVIAIGTCSLLFNTFLAKRLPLVERLILILHIVGLFAIIIPLWVLAPRRDARIAFTEFSNKGGWSSTGLSGMIGLITSVNSILGYDCGVHMSEEVKDAGRVIPISILSAFGLNSFLGLVLIITLCFTIGDVDNILATRTGYPFIQLFYNVTQSNVGTNIMVAIITFVLAASNIPDMATGSRQLWSFARDGGVPFSKQLARVNPGWGLPLNAIIVSLCVTCLLSLINIGSTVTLNALTTLSTSALITSYMLSITCLLIKRLRGQRLPKGRWSLGRWGMAVNVVSLIFLIPIFILSFFPTVTPVQPTSMNWNVVIYAGVLIFATAWYFVSGKHYTPPVLLVKRDV